MLETKITELRGAFSDDEADQLWSVLTSHRNLKKIDAELDSILADITSEMTDTNIQALITSRAIPQKTECEPCDCLGGYMTCRDYVMTESGQWVEISTRLVACNGWVCAIVRAFSNFVGSILRRG